MLTLTALDALELSTLLLAAAIDDTYELEDALDPCTYPC